MSKKSELVTEAVRRFGHLPDRTIARYLLHEYGPTFEGNLEAIRSAIRYRRGHNGEHCREKCAEIIPRGPVKLPASWVNKSTPYKLKPGLWLVLSDAHVPFHEKKPLEAAVKYAQGQKIDGILFNGDMQDCAAVSYWPSTRKREFNREVELFLDFLDWIENEFPGKPIVYKPGNHEYRLPRYYASKAPELIGMPIEAMTAALGLEYRGIEFLDYFQVVMAGKLPVIHGHEIRRLSYAVNPARGLFLKAKSWALCGHCHSASMHTEKDIRGTIITTWSTGCLCDLSPEYCPLGNSWGWGFALINVEKNGNFEVRNMRVLPSGAVV